MKRRLVYLLLVLFILIIINLILGKIFSISRADMTRNNMIMIAREVKKYFIEHKKLPENLKDLKLDISVYKDAWGKPIIYKIENGEVLLISCGADGKQKDSKKNSNIVVRWFPTMESDSVIRWGPLEKNDKH